MSELETIQSLVAEVRSEIGEPSPSFFTNAEITSWLNYGVKLFARKTRILKTTATYSWPVDTDSVELTTVLPLVVIPNGTAEQNASRTQYDPKISMVEWHDGRHGTRILSVSKREIILNEPSRPVSSVKGPPCNFFYSPWEGTVGLQPTPNVNGTLIVYYSYEPAKMVYDSNTPLDANLSKYSEDIAAYAIYRAKLKDVDHYSPQEAQESLGRFLSVINTCKAEAAVEDGPDIIGFVSDYAEPY